MTPIALAKPAIDVGLMTNDLDANAATLAELRVPFDHLLKVGGGIHQHRYACGDSVVKLNSHRGALVAAPTGYARLRLATPVEEPKTVQTVDGVDITAVPVGHDGITTVEVTLRTAQPDEAERFFRELGATADGDRSAIGDSWIVIDAVDEHPPTAALDARGFRYLTVQVRDVEAAHAHMVGAGFTEGRPPVRLGDTAYISFVRDADGNWVELSQRASLTGPLPDVPAGRYA